MNLDFRCERAVEGARGYAAARYNGHQCGECQFAQLFALEGRAECVATGNEHLGQMRIMTSPACQRFVLRPAGEVVMARFVAAPTQTPTRRVAHAS